MVTRRTLTGALALAVLSAGTVVAAVGGTPSAAPVAAVRTAAGVVPAEPSPSPAPASPSPAVEPVDHPAWTAAHVATVWVKPKRTRPVDRPLLRARPDVTRWMNRQSLRQRSDLARRVMTQTLHGERVIVLRRHAGWSKVRLPHQRGSYFRDGIIGWVRTSQLLDHPTRHRADLLHVRRGKAHGLDAVRLAARFLGVRYLWGGMSPAGIDCSGLTYQVFRQLGRTLPRDAADQARVGRHVHRHNLRAGDLVFFGPGGWRTVHHVGIYTGNGMVLHAPHTGSVVQFTPLSAWTDYWGARRLL